MAAPLFIVGDAVQAMTRYIWFSAFFWALAGLGLCALWWSYFYAAYRIYVLGDQLIFACPQGIRAIPYVDMLTLEKVRVVPPKWLIILSSLTSSSGRGSSGQTGSARLLSTSSAGGFCIGTREGAALYIWANNSMGQNSLTRLDLLLNSLKATPAQKLPDIREFQAMFPPVIEKSSRAMKEQSAANEAQQETDNQQETEEAKGCDHVHAPPPARSSF
jgi:hypothetical protein